MTASSDYHKQVELLMDVLPTVAKEPSFALNGGTAINMFYQDMSRLSVDIDLTWLPVADHSSSLRDINSTLNRIASSIKYAHPGSTVTRFPNQRVGLLQIYVKRDEAGIKNETSTTARGTVMPARMIETSDFVTKQFGFVTMNVVSFEDIYAGKICAALERKHPRDLFDVMVLYNNGGFTDSLFRVLMVYVACSSQPMHKVLSPSNCIQKELYDLLFEGLTEKKALLDTFIETGQRLHSDIASRLSGKIATFLLTLHDTKPDFGLVGFPEAAELPAIR